MPLPTLSAERFCLRRPLSDALYGPVGLYEDAQRSEIVAIKQVSLARAVAALRRNPNMDNPWSEHRVVSRLMTLPPHANIVRFRSEFLHAQDTWCVVMEFCPGGDLWDLLKRAPKNRLPENKARQLFRQCAYYMAPEVVNQEAYDAFAADMWSLGIMLFIMLTGSPLTSNASRGNKAFAAFCELGVAKVIDSWGLSDRISAETVGLLHKLLSVNPADRPTANELLEFLEVTTTAVVQR
ncbi:Protein kinase-like domain [Phytophthora cactorum]|nr:Protein kinase-like domain [Phytophthora cactorum]